MPVSEGFRRYNWLLFFQQPDIAWESPIGNLQKGAGKLRFETSRRDHVVSHVFFRFVDQPCSVVRASEVFYQTLQTPVAEMFFMVVFPLASQSEIDMCQGPWKY